MKSICIHSLLCIQCIQNKKHISILKENKESVSESLAMKLLGVTK